MILPDQSQTKCVLDFINKTYFQHFNLYKYVLTRPREQDYTHHNKKVFIPDEPAALNGGVEEFQWRW